MKTMEVSSTESGYSPLMTIALTVCSIIFATGGFVANNWLHILKDADQIIIVITHIAQLFAALVAIVSGGIVIWINRGVLTKKSKNNGGK